MASGASGSYSSMAYAASKKCGRSEIASARASIRRAAARRQVDRQANRRLLAPREEVAKAGQVEEMVGVHVADDDPGQLARVR